MLPGAGLRIHNEFCTAPYIYVLVVVVVNMWYAVKTLCILYIAINDISSGFLKWKFDNDERLILMHVSYIL